MSEEGWREFVAAGLDDWAVTHSGAVAAYVADSLPGAARLAAAVAEVPGLDGSGVLLTAGDRRLTVRLTRGVFQGEAHHIELARRISEVARELGATSDRAAVQSVQITVSARPDEIDLGFWRAVLGYDPLAEDNGIDPLGHGSTVWLQELDPAKPLRHAMHLDVSVPRDQVEARLAAALAAGGRIVSVEDLEASWILADRAGNKVCLVAWPDAGIAG
jgi:4a-hydroxytetrahydrobiopterin dehydratase